MVCIVLQLCLKGLITRFKKKEGRTLKLEARSIVKLRSTMAMLIKTPQTEGGKEIISLPVLSQDGYCPGTK